MSEIQEDVIKIRVEADTGTTLENLKALKEEVNGVKKGLGDEARQIASAINGLTGENNNLDGFVDSVRRFADGIGAFSEVDPTIISKSAEALSKIGSVLPSFENINAGNMKAAALAIGDLPAAIEKLSHVDAENIAQSAKSLNDIASATQRASSVGNGISALSRGLKTLPESLSGFQNINAENITQSAKSLNAIAYAAQRASSVGSGIYSLSNGLKNLPDNLSNFKVDQDFSGNIEGLSNTLSQAAPVLSDFATASKSGSTAIKALGDGLANLNGVGGADEIRDTLDSLTPALEGFVSNFNSRFADIDTSQISSISPVIESLSKGIDRLNNTPISNIKEQFEAVSSAVTHFVESINSGVSDEAAQKFERIAQAVDQVAQAYSKLDAAQSAVSKSRPDSTIGKQAAEISKQLAASAFRSVGSTLKSIPSYAKTAFSALSKIASMPFQPFLDNIKSVGNFISRLQRMAVSAVFYRGIKAAIANITRSIQTGIGNLYQWALTQGNSFVGTMDSIASSAQYLTNSLGAAASPLLDAIAPALETIVNMAVSAINAIAQLIAMLTGATTWRKAVRQQVSFAEAADSAGGSASKAKKAVDEYKNTVMGFDELNKLNDVNDSSSGSGGSGGGGGADYSGMFEEVPIDPWFEQFNSADWTLLGKTITDKMADAMESINWSLIQSKSELWATRFATLLNGAFDNKRFWVDLGTTIGEGVNTAVIFSNTFFDTTKFESLGDSIGETLRKAMHKIDWAGVGLTLTNGFASALDALHGFVSNWSIKDWEYLGQSVADMINSAFKRFNWKRVFGDFVNLATGILHGINTTLRKTDFSGIVDSIKDGWNSLSEKDKQRLRDEFAEFIRNILSTARVLLELEDIVLDIAEDALETACDALIKDIQENGIRVPKLLLVIGGFNLVMDTGKTLGKLALGKLLLNGLGLGGGATAAGGEVAKAGLGLGSKLGIGIGSGLLAGFSVSQLLDQAFNTVNLKQYGLSLGSAAAGGAGIGFLVGGPMGAGFGAGIGAGIAELGELGAGIANWFTASKQARQANANLAASYTTLAQSMGRSGKLSQSQVASFTRVFQTGTDKQIQAAANLLDSVLNGSMTAGQAVSQLNSVASTTSSKYANSMSALGASTKNAASIVSRNSSSISTSTKKLAKDITGSFSSIKGVDKFGNDAISNLVRGLESGNPAVKSASEAIATNSRTALSKISDTYDFGSKGVKNLSLGISSSQSLAAASASSVATLAKSKLKLFQDSASEYGSKGGSNFATGIGSAQTATGTNATNVYNKAANVFKSLSSSTNSWGSSATNNFATGIGSKSGATNVSNNANAIGKKVTAFKTYSGSVASWATDMVIKFANGMISKGAISKLDVSVKTVGNKIKYAFQHCAPTEGPLVGDDKWMPDMVKLFAQGMQKTAPQLTAASNNLATSIASPFGGLSTDMEVQGASLMASMARGVSGNSGLVAGAMNAISMGQTTLSGQVMGDFEADVETALISALSVFAADDEPETPIILRIDSEDIARSSYKGRQKLARRGLTLQLA